MARRTNARKIETEPEVIDNTEQDATQLDQLRTAAISARDEIVKTLSTSGLNARDAWLQYGQVLVEARSVIPSNKEFNEWITSNQLDEFGKVGGDEKNHRNERAAAMQMARLAPAVLDYVAREFPDVNKPRAVMYQVGKLKARLNSVLLEAEQADLYHNHVNPTKLTGDSTARQMTLEKIKKQRDQEIGSAIKYVNERMEEDTHDGEALTNYNVAKIMLEHQSPEEIAVDYAAFKQRRKNTRAKFVEMSVEEAVAHLVKLIATHPEKAAVGEALASVIEDNNPFVTTGAEDDDDEGEGEPEDDETEGETEGEPEDEWDEDEDEDDEDDEPAPAPTSRRRGR